MWHQKGTLKYNLNLEKPLNEMRILKIKYRESSEGSPKFTSIMLNKYSKYTFLTVDLSSNFSLLSSPIVFIWWYPKGNDYTRGVKIVRNLQQQIREISENLRENSRIFQHHKQRKEMKFHFTDSECAFCKHYNWRVKERKREIKGKKTGVEKGVKTDWRRFEIIMDEMFFCSLSLEGIKIP